MPTTHQDPLGAGVGVDGGGGVVDHRDILPHVTPCLRR